MNMAAEKQQFISELRESKVRLCKRAACSLGVAWSDLNQANKRIEELENSLSCLLEFASMMCEQESVSNSSVDLARVTLSKGDK